MVYILTSGEYSDYTIEGVYEGPPGLDLKQIRAEIDAEVQVLTKKHDEDYCFDAVEEFRKLIVSRYGLTTAEHKEWWTGAYGVPAELKRC